MVIAATLKLHMDIIVMNTKFLFAQTEDKQNLLTIHRTKHLAGGNLHTSMSGSCGVCVDGVLYLFGGHHARGNTNRVKFVC